MTSKLILQMNISAHKAALIITINYIVNTKETTAPLIQNNI